jgi:hypothetical protein
MSARLRLTIGGGTRKVNHQVGSGRIITAGASLMQAINEGEKQFFVEFRKNFAWAAK